MAAQNCIAIGRICILGSSEKRPKAGLWQPDFRMGDDNFYGSRNDFDRFDVWTKECIRGCFFTAESESACIG